MYHLDWDAMRDDTGARRWTPILVGAGVGLTLGYLIGWMADDPDSLWPWGADDPTCIMYVVNGKSVGNGCSSRKTIRFRITGSLVGIGAGAALGWLWPFGED